MEELKADLLELINNLPRSNSQNSLVVLNGIFDDYRRILNLVNSTNEELRRNSILYYSELSDIEFKIRQAQYGKSDKVKNTFFQEAIACLKSDIEALACLVDNS